MRLGFNGATTMTSPLETDIRIASEAGYDALEITATKLDKFLETHSIQDARKLIDAAKLKTHAINSIERINSDPRDQVLARTRQRAEYAHALDCPWIVCVPGPAPEGTAWKKTRDGMVATLRALNDVSAPLGVNLAFEFLGFPWCAVQTAAQAWEIVKTINLPTVGIVVDTCHMYSGGSKIDSLARIDKKKLAVFHLSDVESMPPERITDAHRLFPGDGVIPLRGILGTLRGIGFDGVVSVEISRPEYWQRDPLSVAREAREKTKGMLGM